MNKCVKCGRPGLAYSPSSDRYWCMWCGKYVIIDFTARHRQYRRGVESKA